MKFKLAILPLLFFCNNLLSQTWTLYGNMPGTAIRSIAIDSSNDVWTASFDAGVGYFDLVNPVTYNTSNSSLASNITLCVTIDSEGNKWIGTYNQGLYKFDGSTWTNYNKSNSGLPWNQVNAIGFDENGVLWACCQIGGLAKFDGSAWTVYKTTQGLPSNNVNGIAFENSHIWLATYAGLSDFDGTTFTNYTTSNSSLPHNQVYCVVIDDFNNKWIGTAGGLLKIDNLNNWSSFTTNNSGIPHDYVQSIAIDSSNIWVGTSQGGLGKFDGVSTWETFNPDNSLCPDFSIRSLAVDYENNLWVGSNVSGLAFFGTQNFTSTKIKSDDTKKPLIIQNNSQIVIKQNQLSGSKVCLTTIDGKIVLSDFCVGDVCFINKELFPKGVYFTTVSNSNGCFNEKIVIE